tara:strand:- start:1506 stop:2021 length:516 start_codon:yes stop_codon:yes gene_type:complete
MKIVAAYVFGESSLGVEKLDFVSYMQRGPVRELLRMFAKEAASELGRKVYTYDDRFHFVCMKKELAVVLVTDAEYPTRVSFGLLAKIFERPDDAMLKYVVDMCQDPRQVDQLFRIRAELDETLVIAHQNIDKLLARGDDLDVLVSKSKSLSDSTKVFYKTARRHNRCCQVQ